MFKIFQNKKKIKTVKRDIKNKLKGGGGLNKSE